MHVRQYMYIRMYTTDDSSDRKMKVDRFTSSFERDIWENVNVVGSDHLSKGLLFRTFHKFVNIIKYVKDVLIVVAVCNIFHRPIHKPINLTRGHLGNGYTIPM